MAFDHIDRVRYGEYPKNVSYTSTMYNNNQKKKALHVSFSPLFGNSFYVILHSHQIGLRIDHLSMLHVLFGFNTFKNIYRFFNQFRKDDVEKIESICSSFFFYIENCFFYQRNSKKYACD